MQLKLTAVSLPVRNEARAPLTRSGVFEIVLVVFSGLTYWVPEGSLAETCWAGFRLIFGQTWPQTRAALIENAETSQAWVPECSLAGICWVGFRPIFGQTWPQDSSRSTGLVLQCRLHQKSTRQTNSMAISWRQKTPARLPSGTQQAALARNIIILFLFPALAAGIMWPRLSKLGPIGLQLFVSIVWSCMALIIEMHNLSYLLIMTGADPTKYMGGFGEQREGRAVGAKPCLLCTVTVSAYGKHNSSPKHINS